MHCLHIFPYVSCGPVLLYRLIHTLWLLLLLHKYTWFNVLYLCVYNSLFFLLYSLSLSLSLSVHLSLFLSYFSPLFSVCVFLLNHYRVVCVFLLLWIFFFGVPRTLCHNKFFFRFYFNLTFIPTNWFHLKSFDFADSRSFDDKHY